MPPETGAKVGDTSHDLSYLRAGGGRLLTIAPFDAKPHTKQFATCR